MGKLYVIFFLFAALSEAKNCDPLLVSVIDYGPKKLEESSEMLSNFFGTLRNQSTIEFLALSSTEDRCRKLTSRWNTRCDVAPEFYQLRWPKQMLWHVLIRMLHQERRPVLFVDTDVRFDRDPLPLFRNLCRSGIGFAAGDEGGWKLNSGTVLVSPSATAFSILNCSCSWTDRVKANVSDVYARFVSKTPLSKVPTTNSLSFEQDTLQDCFRNEITAETEMRFALRERRAAVAVDKDAFNKEVHAPHPVYGYGVSNADKLCRLLEGSQRCASKKLVRHGNVVLLKPPYYAGPSKKELSAIKHCVGKARACLYRGDVPSP